MRRHARALLILGLAPAWLLPACKPSAPAGPPPAPVVSVAQPTRRTVTIYDEFVGTTRASESVEIRARVRGRLEGMSFEPSHVVQEDQLLFVIEQPPFEAARDAAAASVASAKAQLGRAEADLARIEQAARTDAVSKSDVDLARAERDVAAASLQSAEASLEQAEIELSYTEVRSPIAGQVGRNLIDVGNLVGEAQSSLLTTVNKLRPLYVYFDAPEENVLRALKELDWEPPADGETLEGPEGSKFMASVGTLIDDGFPYEGYVDYISNTVDSGTGTIELRLVLSNDDLSLFPGLFVRVRAPREELEDAVVIHERAIGTDLGGRYVYVVGKDNVVEQRYIEFDQVQDDGTVPVTAGLEGNETYIVEGLLRARPGLPVQPEPLSAAGER